LFSWFALRVLRGNHERSIQNALRLRKIEEFLPVYKVRARWSDRIKEVEKLLFPGYIFARVDYEAGGLYAVTVLSGVQVLPSNLAPQKVDDNEVETIKKLCASELPLLAAEYTRGQTVTINAGPLAGVTGVVAKVRNRYRLTVNVEIFHRAVEVELDSEAVASCRL